MTKNIFFIGIIISVLLLSGCTLQETQTSQSSPDSKTKSQPDEPVIIYTISHNTASTQFPIEKTLDTVKIKNSESFPKELELNGFRFTITDAKLNTILDGKKLHLLINVSYPDNEASKLWGKSETTEQSCDIVFGQSPAATCTLSGGILVDSQTSSEFNGQPVAIHSNNTLIQITEIGYMPSSKTWSYFVLSSIERHVVYNTID